MTVKQYSDLVAWQRAMDLVEEVYKLTKSFPKEELYGLSGQVRRAAISIPSNIAEGQSRSSRDFVHFLSIAHGSLSEVETQMLIAGRLGYLQATEVTEFGELTAEVGRIIRGLSRSIEKLATGHRPLANAAS